MYPEDEYLALSGIQHFSFCRRQWALIHIEQIWKENILTVQGELMHDRAHDEEVRERRGDTLIIRGLEIHSAQLGLTGKCDVVEFHQDPTGHPLFQEDGLWCAIPVEYKRGKSKTNNADRLQLCAQAMCLEDLFGSDIPIGYLYYGETKSRERVEFCLDLRNQVLEHVAEMHVLYKRRHTPHVKRHPACRSCSLLEICLPEKNHQQTVADYLALHLRRE